MTRRLLIPKEHGTWGELLFPLVTVLAVGRVEASAIGLSVAALCGYLSSEALQTLAGWRGPRVGRERRRDALASLGVFGGLAIAAGAWAYVRSSDEVRVTVWLAGGATLLAVGIAARGGLRTAGGEVLAALTLGAWSVPAALAAGVSWRSALGMWLLWGAVFGGGTLAVRALIARQTRRDGRWGGVAGLAIVGVALGVQAVFVRDGHVSWVVLAGFLPAALLVATVAVAPIPARRLRWVGWSLVAASVVLGLALVAAAAERAAAGRT